MDGMFVVKFLVLMVIIVGPIIFILHHLLVRSTEGAVKRLNDEAEKTRQKQTELTQKVKEANEELDKRKSEADTLTNKMITEAEGKAKEEREKLIARARIEGEEIITKAQATKDKIRREIEKDMELKIINYSVNILNSVLSQKARGALDQQLITEFIESFEKIDMTKINPDVDAVEVITISAIDVQVTDKITKILKTKLKRDMKVVAKTDPNLLAGVVLRFGSLGLDGSLRNLILEASVSHKKKIEGN